ncbi:preprotein translocase subunit TatC [Niveispirillum lacus]|uniref:Preprotein translocase subunit TatC n=1 Tax=Niveispirillum lacus TaxID=1981099 RepID=A0A255YU82_9PROT|nr:group III truncated hemoglobin [Niveispirillum lacus]OYQ32739.1 preprotein translocase subunit TatC [Niveispirillum lacus]
MDERQLAHLVERFYAKVRQDPALGPIFNDAIGDWDHHLNLLTDFWSSVMLASGQYKGNPMAAHLRHRARLTPALFALWLNLWDETAKDVLSPQDAAAIRATADRIARSLQLGLQHIAA